MQVVIEIPEESIPQNQAILIVDLHFIDGQICECNYPFQELPKNHGRLIDANDVFTYDYIAEKQLSEVPTVIGVEGILWD